MHATDQLSHVRFFPPHDASPRLTTAVAPLRSAASRTERECEALEENTEDGAFLAWLLTRAGLPHRGYRAKPLLRRLPACSRAVDARNTREAKRRLEAQPELLPKAIGAVIIGVTFFFRDARVFDQLQTVALPRLLARRAGLRIWSAGCADGCELYSAAMLLAEAGVVHDCTFLGTDCRASAVSKAAAGTFHEHAMSSVDDARRAQHFTRRGEVYTVNETIRSRTRFETGDLLTAAAAGSWDVIFCRNVAIYLQPLAAQAMWARLAGALSPGGLLVTGRAERPAARGLRRVGDNIYEKGEA